MTIKDAIEKNLIWILTTLLAIGAYGATIKMQGEIIDKHSQDIAECKDIQSKFILENKDLHTKDEISNKEQVNLMDKRLVRIETMVGQVQSDVGMLRDDMKDLKKVIMKPAFTLANDNTHDIVVASVETNLVKVVRN